jgi:hypothetical protein
MARIVFSVVGNMIAPGIGGVVGGLIGGIVDSVLFQKKLPDVVGPRLANLATQISSYGRAVNQVYGNARIAGNVIWALDLQELAETSEAGGKGSGGGGQSFTNFTYLATLAIAICEGEITGVGRVFADGKELKGDVIDKGNPSFEVFLGTETQEPSSIMEAALGVGNVPAYKGTAYVVIENFPVGDYGNRVPNFTFEVLGGVSSGKAVQDKIKNVVLIPGSGEWVYKTEIVYKDGLVYDTAGNPYTKPYGKNLALNSHGNLLKPNVTVALDNLKESLPNIECVAVVVNWFCRTKNPGTAVIKPQVENAPDNFFTTSKIWEVSGLDKNTAPVCKTFPDGTKTYGGTPSDDSILELCQLLKARGYKVMLYPMLLIDTTGEESGELKKPWRGRMIPGSTADVTAFFNSTWGYKNFIEHYSSLVQGFLNLKDYIDYFLIGSEFVGLTGYDSGGGTFPAVTRLKELAANVRADLSGTSVEIGYAADWTEYHSKEGLYNLDPLWTDNNIDFVGIDAYFPLTPDLPQSQIYHDKIVEYWEKAEGWDYYWNEDRTVKTFYSGSTFAWKNVAAWWNSTHTNPDGAGTGWTPKLKKIFFTEVGFPSVDGAANQPNVFVDPSSSESFYPRGSEGRVDFEAQLTAIDATADYLNARNAISGNSGLVPRWFLWAWDSRPFPQWPLLKNVWADGANFTTGHWVQGKLQISLLSKIIETILKRAGYKSNQYDVTKITGGLRGFVATDSPSARQLLEQLAVAFPFDMIESNGKLKFIPRGGDAVRTISYDDFLPNAADGVNVRVETVLTQGEDMPRSVTVSYINADDNYQTNSYRAARQVTQSYLDQSINIPLVLTPQEAKNIADRLLYQPAGEYARFNFALGPKHADLEPSDVVVLDLGNRTARARITSAEFTRNGTARFEAFNDELSLNSFYLEFLETKNNLPSNYLPPKVNLIILDLPPLPQDDGDGGIITFAATAESPEWQGAQLYRSNDGGVTYKKLHFMTDETVYGVVLSLIPDRSAAFPDMETKINVSVSQSNALSSCTEEALYNGANAALLGEEIIQFRDVQLEANGTYTLSILLRGRLGTEKKTVNHVLGEDLLMLNSNLFRLPVPVNQINTTRHYKLVPVGKNIAQVDAVEFTYKGIALECWDIAQLKGERDASGNLTISWVRRARVGGEWRPNVDVHQPEKDLSYEIVIKNGLSDVRTAAVTQENFIYTAAMQVADFGSLQSSVELNIYQISDITGRGRPAAGTL